jgi:tetratricopeptide (TPR) repeat protein
LKSSLSRSAPFASINRLPHTRTGRRGLFLATTTATILTLCVVQAHANLPAWMEQVVGNSSIESALYRLMDLPGLRTLYPRPPAEARTELSSLVASDPADPELYALRAQTDEQSLDFIAAEADWKAYSAHAKDIPAAQLELADFYHRRLQPEQEIATLLAVAAAPSPDTDRYRPAEQQRSWHAYDRILELANDLALQPEVTLTTYTSWIKRYPAEPSVRAALINTLIRQKRFDQAVAAIADFKAAFPQDTIFPVKASALVEYQRGSLQKALALYDASFQPLWPSELVQSYFGMLAAQHQQRAMLAAARAQLAHNPDDLASATRVFYYFQQQGNLAAAARSFEEYRLSKEFRKAAWTPDELYTIATLLNGVGLYELTARYDFALYNTPGKLTSTPESPQEAALSSIVHLLLTAPEQPIYLGSGNLSLYRDIATVDRGPGYLNGILSLWLNSTSPASEFHEEERRATPYFHHAKAAELLALLDRTFPDASSRSSLHAAMVSAYTAYGDDQATIAAGNAFLDAFPTAAERVPVAIIVADSYARTNNPTAEFALYNELLSELARNAQGQPLTASATSNRSSTQQPVPQSEEQPETSSVAPSSKSALDLTTTRNSVVMPADNLTYSQVLERYLGRLTTTKRLPEALAVLRREIDRNPDDPLLYERLADFLQQNNLAAQQEEVYRRAIARFPGPTFYDKLARFYLRLQRKQDFDTLTRQVVDTFRGTGLEQYFSIVNQSGPQLYLQLNLYAHQRFPHELRFTRNLLAAYQAKATADPAALDLLLRQHWFEAADLRNQFFDALSRTGKLDAELAALAHLVPSESQEQQNPAATRELAEGQVWQSHFEVAAPLYSNLVRSYPADATLGEEAASIFRSLAYFDPGQAAQAIAIEKNLLAADPANVERLARIGDIYADSQSAALAVSAEAQIATASPYWRRIPTIHPGQPDGYLQSATIFWDYFQFNDALAQIAAARKQFHSPVLYGYEAGAIAENKLAPAQAVAEYVAASTADEPNSNARARLITLANRPAYAALIDEATAKAVAGDPNLGTLSLRADILTARHQQGGIASLVDNAITHATTSDQAGQLATFAQQHQLIAGYRHALDREIVLSADPVQRIQLQYTLAQSFADGKDLAAAQTIVESVHRDNPKLLGVVRFTTDFYWNAKQPQQAIATLTQASREANPELSRAFTLEAATKSNQSGDYAGARSLLAPLLAADPYDPRYLATQADSYALAQDNAGLRDFYTTTLATLRTANLPTETRRDKTALLRQGLIVALTHLKDYEGATDQHIALISAFPDDSDIAQNAALYALQYDRKQQLMAFLNKTVADSPRDSRFAIILARVSTLYEDYPAALAAYSKAIAIRKDRPDLYIARADLEEHQQNFDAACADYDRLYLLTYKDPQWMLKSAEARARQDKNDLAVRALQAAYIDGRPKDAQNYFKVAAQLEAWNLLDQARTFADQGVELAGNDLLASAYNRDGLLTYVRIMTRERHAADAFSTMQGALIAAATTSAASPSVIVEQIEKQGIAAVSDDEWRRNLIAQRQTQAQSSYQNALRQIGLTVAQFYTPEEKLAYAQLLDTQRNGKAAAEVASTWIPAAESAGLKDREAQWRKDLLLAGGKIGDAQLSAYDTLEQQRMDNVALAKTLEAYAATRPAATRDGVLARAVSAWSDEGNPTAELRVIRSMNLRSDDYAALRERYFQLLLRMDQRSLLDQASSSNAAYADAAANYILANAAEPFAQSAVDARARSRQPVWASATTALVGLFFADSSPRIAGAFHAALGDNTVADRLATRPDRSSQLVSTDWFYYGMRYGVYRTLSPTPADDPEDFLSSGLEAQPTAPDSYIALGRAYADASRPDDAAREYHHALELNPRTPAIHRDVAVTYWPISKPSTNREEALDQWNAALSLLRAQVDLRAVPESFWFDFTAIAQDAHDRNLGVQLRPAMDTVLRAYIAKNGNYRSSELLHSAYIALSPAGADAAIAWVFSLVDAARNPSAILNQLASPYEGGWFPRESLGRLYRRQLELAQLTVAEQTTTQTDSSDSNTLPSDLTRARLRLLTYLIQQKQDAEAQSLLDTIPDAERQQDAVQQARILLAAHQSRIPALLADFTAHPSTVPSLQLIAAAASQLRTAGDKSSNRLLVEYVFQQKFQQHELTPPDYLALAQARLDLNDLTAALEILRRLILLPSPSNSSSDLYANLDSAASLLEQSGHPGEALPFLTTLANATPWNPAYRLRLAQTQTVTHQNAVATLTALASTAVTPYAIRAQAAAALKSAPGSHTFDSVELTLLAASSITPQQASQPYLVPARVAAADLAPMAKQPALLRDAMATAPSDNLRLTIFRVEFALGHTTQALAAIKPLLQSPNGYARFQIQQGDVQQVNQAQGSTNFNQYTAADYDALGPMDERSLPNDGGNSATLPTILRTREEKVTFALAVATLYEKLDEPAQAYTYLRSAAALNRDPARGKLIAKRVVTTDARVQLDNENQSRRPIIQPNLNQAVVVRPRLTNNSEKVRP